MAPTFPEIDFEVVRDGVLATSEDPSIPDQVIGCAVVAKTVIHGREAQSVVKIVRDLADNSTDETLIGLARPNLAESFKELADQQLT